MSDVVTQNVEWGKIMNYEHDGHYNTHSARRRAMSCALHWLLKNDFSTQLCRLVIALSVTEKNFCNE